MSATLTLDLFRPSILDPVEDEEQLRGPGIARDRAPERVPAPAAPVGGDRQAQPSTVQQGGGPTLDDLIVGVWEGLTAHRTVACPACGGARGPPPPAAPPPPGRPRGA